ncbi:MAG: hypothetical protein Q4E24_00680 [bacterium]|nr:hypothetical protein [bacterium]
MESNWKQDPRLKNMSPQKLEFLEQLAEKAKHASKTELLPLLLNISRQNPSMNFTDEETELLVSILTEHFSPKEKQQLKLLRQLSVNLSKRQ